MTFRRWGNLMTIIFPAMMTEKKYRELDRKNLMLGRFLKNIVKGCFPVKIKWMIIRTIEFFRRKLLLKVYSKESVPDALLFHGYSFEKKDYNLIIEVFENKAAVFRQSIRLHYGENLRVFSRKDFDACFWKAGNLIKVYPEENIEAELDLLWCDFVQGKPIDKDQPAEKVKCLVWDLDNTIWDGVLVETDDPLSLVLKPGVLEIIESLDNRGVLQSVASKNNEEDVLPLLEELGISQYMLYPQVNWGSKSQSLKIIADELNIGIDSLALIDDSVFERGEVNYHLPQVRTYDTNILNDLLYLSEFDFPITEESKKRRFYYQTEIVRNQDKRRIGQGLIEFIKQCEMEVVLFRPVSNIEKERCFELLQRTNQLNMTGRKYSEDEYHNMLVDPEKNCFAFSVRDRYGSYGIVGFVQYTIVNNELVITEFAMSCRVAGKYIEAALVASLLQKEHKKQGRMIVQITKKNVFLRSSLEEIGFKKTGISKKSLEYEFRLPLNNQNLIRVRERSKNNV